jgi:tetratricopeptide (TPR) repeat protein
MEIENSFNVGDLDYALRELKGYVAEHPDSYRGWSLLGWVYAKTDELEKAGECFDRSLGINPEWDNAHVGKGVIYRSMGDLNKARESYCAAIKIAPDNPEAFSSLLVIELMEGNDEKAVEYGEKAWALRKDYAAIPANLAVAYHYFGDYSKRDEFYKEAVRLGYPDPQRIKDIFSGKTSIR